MKIAVHFCALGLFVFCPSISLADRIGVYEDRYATNCNISDAQDGGIFVPESYVYMVHNDTDGAVGSSWRARIPDCAMFQLASEALEPGLTADGDSQTGISVTYGTCRTNSIFIMTITLYTLQNTPRCCEWPVTPNPPDAHALATDCDSNVEPMVRWDNPINPDWRCECWTAWPTEPATWGAIKSQFSER